MHVKKVYDDGAIFEPKILDITTQDIRSRFQTSITNMASISLASGYITKPAMPHLLINAFKNLAFTTFTTDYTFKQADALKEAAKKAPVVAAVKEEAPKAKKPKDEPKVVEKEPEADVNMGGLFGEDEDM